jgi:hypothetical protein
VSMNNFTESTILKILEWAYDKALDGLPGLDTAEELAESYLKKYSSVDKAIDSLIRWQDAKCATSGFLAGLGGLITLPVTVPAEVASVTYVQTRMVAAIAYMRGYDVRDDQVKAFVFVCLAGQAALDILKQAGVSLAERALKKISEEVIEEITRQVATRLATKFGQRGIVDLGKAVPIVSGVIGGFVDGLGTHTIGKIAKRIFI